MTPRVDNRGVVGPSDRPRGLDPSPSSRPEWTQSNSGLSLAVPPELLEAVAERAAELVADRLEALADDRWLTVEDAAGYIGCPRSRIYALVSARRIPHERDGSRLLFKRSELDAWVRAGGGTRP